MLLVYFSLALCFESMLLASLSICSQHSQIHIHIMVPLWTFISYHHFLCFSGSFCCCCDIHTLKSFFNIIILISSHLFSLLLSTQWRASWFMFHHVTLSLSFPFFEKFITFIILFHLVKFYYLIVFSTSSSTINQCVFAHLSFQTQYSIPFDIGIVSCRPLWFQMNWKIMMGNKNHLRIFCLQDRVFTATFGRLYSNF